MALETDTDADVDGADVDTVGGGPPVFPLTPQWVIDLSVCCLLLADPWQDPYGCGSKIL